MTDIFGKTKGYTYDSAGRLKEERNTKITNQDSIQELESDYITYSYDTRGNRLSMYNSKETLVQYEYNANNRLISKDIDVTDEYNYGRTPPHQVFDRIKYVYDNNGNLTSKLRSYHIMPEIGDGEDYVYDIAIGDENYTYDLNNKMKGYSSNEYETEKSVIASCVYDGTGTRIGKTVDGVSIGQIWNNGNVIAEYGTKGTKTYIWGAGGEIVKTKDSASNSRYFSYNAHGDTINIIEKNAESTSFAVTATYEYDAFGGLVSGTGGEADSNGFRYNGQYIDEETGLIYLRNRYYDPSIGRFTQEDPYWNPGNMIYGDQQFEEGEVKIPDYYAIVQSSNLYVYCVNDPVNGVDPSGNYYVIDDIERAIWKLGAKYYLDEYKGWYLTGCRWTWKLICF